MTMKQFLNDESGTMTVWLLVWSIVFIGFAGLAVDVSNLYRTRALLQATADAAAHAGAIKLMQSGQSNVVTEARAMAQSNLATADYGDVVEASDVEVGYWDPVARTFSSTAPSGLSVNAVRVVARRDDNGTDNSLPTSLLRIINYNSWNVAAVAIASADSISCSDYENKIIALGEVQFTSNWDFGGNLCIHGEIGIGGNQGNEVVQGEQVLFSMVNTDEAQNKSSLSTSAGWYVPGCTDPNQPDAECKKDANTAANIVPNVGIKDSSGVTVPGGITGTIEYLRDQTLGKTVVTWDQFVADPNIFTTTPNHVLHLLDHGTGQANQEVRYAQALAAGAKNIYITCGLTVNNDVFSLSSNGVSSLAGVTLYTGPASDTSINRPCRLQGTSNLNLTGTVIVSTSTAIDSVQVAAGPSTGAAACGSFENGLRIFSAGGVIFNAQADFPTLQILAKGDVSYTSQLGITQSVEIITEGDFSMTSAGADGTLTPACPTDPTQTGFGEDSIHIVY